MRPAPIWNILNSRGQIASMVWCANASSEHEDGIGTLTRGLGLDAAGVQTIALNRFQVRHEHQPRRSTFHSKSTLTVFPWRERCSVYCHREMAKEYMPLLTHHTYTEATMGAWSDRAFGIVSSQPLVQEFMATLDQALKTQGRVRLELVEHWTGCALVITFVPLEDEVSRQGFAEIPKKNPPGRDAFGLAPQRLAA